jgi:hypothetical protein
MGAALLAPADVAGIGRDPFLSVRRHLREAGKD